MNKINNKNIHLKLYEEFNTRKKNNEEKNKNTFIMSDYEFGLNKYELAMKRAANPRNGAEVKFLRFVAF